MNKIGISHELNGIKLLLYELLNIYFLTIYIPHILWFLSSHIMNCRCMLWNYKPKKLLHMFTCSLWSPRIPQPDCVMKSKFWRSNLTTRKTLATSSTWRSQAILAATENMALSLCFRRNTAPHSGAISIVSMPIERCSKIFSCTFSPDIFRTVFFSESLIYRRILLRASFLISTTCNCRRGHFTDDKRRSRRWISWTPRFLTFDISIYNECFSKNIDLHSEEEKKTLRNGNVLWPRSPSQTLNSNFWNEPYDLWLINYN